MARVSESAGLTISNDTTYVINKYIAECQRVIDEDGQMPNISHLYDFLDSCVEVFGKEYEHVMKHIGIDTLVRNEYLYRSTK